ncbi:MAG: NAD(P)H-dependent oxidoreductase subunit E [Oscillatoria sp. PMC 1068.18]|nr:NAD(P)H-dependent oxidoreductase subunit E [Oscillatoria sp. PMC 1076.18]MEC4989087.1 NAD(P)H-dependent oxidoreductase subunit E [Oscillatoria sp. PMC 1068.18]
MSKSKKVITDFTLEGRFISFVGDYKKKPKCLRLSTAEGECKIKLAKEIRRNVKQALIPGDWIKISGKKTVKPKNGKIQLKADRLQPTSPAKKQPSQQTTKQVKDVSENRSKDCIMVCQKSSCRKKGAGEICQVVNEYLAETGLEDQVKIKGTGCMKQCKRGPCVVFMPDKSRYIKVEPQQVPQLLAKHFTAQ